MTTVHLADHVCFWSLLLTTLGLGLYFAISKRRRLLTTAELFLGSRTLRMVPLALSTMASTISAVGYIGFTAHFYMYGCHLLWFLPSTLLSMPVFVSTIVLTLYRLRVTSVFQVRLATV